MKKWIDLHLKDNVYSVVPDGVFQKPQIKQWVVNAIIFVHDNFVEIRLSSDGDYGGVSMRWDSFENSPGHPNDFFTEMDIAKDVLHAKRADWDAWVKEEMEKEDEK
jgi:hypothetical protein